MNIGAPFNLVLTDLVEEAIMNDFLSPLEDFAAPMLKIFRLSL